MFDIEAYRKKMEDLYKKGDMAGIVKYFDQSKAAVNKERRVLRTKQEKNTDGFGLTTEEQIHYVLLTSEEEEILSDAAGFYRNTGNWDKCFDTFNELFALIKEAREEGTPGHADALVNFATALRIMGNAGLAERKFKEAEEIYKKNKFEDPFHLATLYNNRAPMYLEYMNYEKAIADFQKALSYLNTIPEAKRDRAMTLTGLGNAYIATGDLKAAEENIDIAMALFEEMDDDPFYGSAVNTKAQIVYMNGDYQKASDLFAKAADITKKFFGESEDYRICLHNYEICLELARQAKEDAAKQEENTAAQAEEDAENAEKEDQ